MLTLLFGALAWSIGEMAVAAIVLAAVVAIVVIIVKAMGLAIPPWAVTVFWIVLLAIVGILAIRFVLSL